MHLPSLGLNGQIPQSSSNFNQTRFIMSIQNHTGRKIWVDYLRSANTVLVMAHHSSLAYTTFAFFEKKA